MVEPFEGKALVRPGGRVEPLDLAPGRGGPWQWSGARTPSWSASRGRWSLGSGALPAPRPGKDREAEAGAAGPRAPEGGRALWVVLGLAQSRLAQDHEALLALLGPCPPRRPPLPFPESSGTTSPWKKPSTTPP